MNTRPSPASLATIVLASGLLVFSGCVTDGAGEDTVTTPPPSDPAAPPPPTGTSHTVSILLSDFMPDHLTIGLGDEICWMNNDIFAHTATADNGGPIDFDTGKLSFREPKCVIFMTAGSVDYHCEIHTSMKGRVTIE